MDRRSTSLAEAEAEAERMSNALANAALPSSAS